MGSDRETVRTAAGPWGVWLRKLLSKGTKTEGRQERGEGGPRKAALPQTQTLGTDYTNGNKAIKAGQPE